MSGSLWHDIISENQYQDLPSDVKNALEENLALKNHSIASLEGEIQRIKADYEQKCYELDKKFIESASRLDSESTQNEKVTARCNELENELEELRNLHKNVEKTVRDLETENVSLRRIKDCWDEDKLSLQHVIQKRDLEVARLNDEWKDLSDRLLEATNSRNELQMKLDETSSSEVTSHYHTKRVEQEKELLSDQNAQLAEDLKQKTKQLLAIQKEKQDEVISLQGQLDLTLTESKQLKDLLETMKKNESTMHEKMNELNEKYNKAAEEYHSMEEMHRNELQSQSRLAQLYKDSSEDAEKKCEELISAVEELQDLVKTNAEENENVRRELGDAKNEAHELFKDTERLKKELEGANDLILANKRRELSDEELAELCPTAALTSKFLKSGMTLTQIYAQYIEQADELIVANEENKRLNDAMDSILNELNEKAPLLKRQREDYERALITINQLTSQTDEAAMEFQQIRHEADDAIRRNELSKRDIERLRKETGDLSKQVCFLLREVEELRGRQILMSPKSKGDKSLLVVNDDGSCNDVSSSSELITQTLVTFKDIAELQEQNQKLLATIRKLSEDQEEAEKSELDEKTKTFQHELELAQDELERLREDRSRQMTLVETIVRQRDMYRVLLAQNPDGGVPPSVLASPSLLANTSWTSTGSVSATPTGRRLSKSPRTPELGMGDSTRKALAQLQEEYTEYKQEVLDNNKVFETKIAKLQDDLLHQKGNCAKLDAQLEFSKERYNIMMNSTDCNKKEADALRNRNHQLYSVIQQHERNVGNLSAELADMRETNSKLQARLDTLQRELDIGKRAEDRLTAENSSLQREHRSQMVLLGNLQKMQQSMEAQAFEVKTQLNTRIESQEREIKSLRQTSHNTAQSKQDEIQKTEKQLHVVQKQYDAEHLKTVKLSHELATLNNDLDNMERERNDAKTKLLSVEERLARISGGSQSVEGTASSGSDQDTIRLLRQEVKEKSHEVLSLEMRLEKLKQHVDHFRDVSVAAEESLKQTNDANKELLDSLQQRLEHSNQQVINLEQQLYKLEEENNLLKNEKYKVTGEVERQTAELRRQLTGVQGELEASLRRRDEAIKNEQIAIDDLKEQVAKAEEANDNYQREMILHAGAVQQLLELKEKGKNSDAEIEKEKSRSLELEESLKEKKEAWSSFEEKLKTEAQQHKQRYTDIEEQNKILHNQIQTLSGRMVELQSMQSPMSTPTKSFYASRDPVAVATAAVESGDFQSNAQLLDVIKFLRREKEIADTKSELVQSELIRCKQQIMQFEKQIIEIQEKLEAEQKRAINAEEQLSGLNSLKREFSILKETEEQNKVLRAERDAMDEDLRSANNRITRIQEDVAPLQSKNRELSAQITVLQADKKASMEEAERWKERVQQMTQSPRRQDPEEYRRLIQEKSILASKVDKMSKDLTDLRTENSNQKGQMRTITTAMQTSKTEETKLKEKLTSVTELLENAKAQIEERTQTVNKIRRVGRRFKQQYEDLLAKQQKTDAEKKAEEEKSAEQPTTAANAGKTEEMESALKQSQANLSEERARLQVLSQELSRYQDENKALKSQTEDATKKLDDIGQSQSELQGENVALRSQNDDRSKNLKELSKRCEDLQKENSEMSEKEKKFNQLLQLAKKQLEKLRKENQEIVKVREKLQEDVKKLENEKKSETEQKAELQSKVEELQSQLNELRSATSIQSSERKAATIRPTPAQQVNQVKPMRVTRTARVMPEPQQEAQDSDRPGSSSAAPQAASSSTQPVVAASVTSVVSVSSHATAFVYPMSPARQQQPVGSSVTSGQGAQSDEARGGESSAEVGEGDNAIVSSSDDQTMQEESAASVPGPSTASGAASVVEGEASSSSSTPRFVAPSSSAALNVSSAANQSRSFTMGQKRSHEEGEESSRPGSSREAQVAVPPISKRQRADQSSESISVVMPSSGTAQTEPPRAAEFTGSPSKLLARSSPSTPADRPKRIVLLRYKLVNRIEERVRSATKANTSTASVSSATRQPDQSQQSDALIVDDNLVEDENQAEPVEQEETVDLETIQESNLIGEEVSQSAQVDYNEDQSEAAMQQDVASSSIEQVERVIVLSSDDEADLDQEEADDMNDVENSEEEEQGPVDEEMGKDIESQTPSTTRPEIPLFPQTQQLIHPSGNLPHLVLPQDTTRPRLPSRPPPLTPGMMFPSSTDDDSIVPCTPTLMTHRVDESYQAISSPRVPPVRFQFEDVTQTPSSLAAVPGGLASVDNTIMDLTGAGGDEGSRNVPSISSSSTAASFSSAKISATSRDTQSPSNNSESAAVSSSIQEELEECEETDQAIPSNVVETSSEARSSIPSQSVRGRRRLRVIGAPRSSRGRGNNSPSTSNQS